MKYLSLDYGSKTVGVAVSDATGSVVRELEIIRREKEKALRRTCARIEEIIKAEGVETIVIGLPLNMDGTEGERAEKTRTFGDMIARRTGLPVRFQDERLTTEEAYEIMDENNIRSREDRKAHADSMAAAVILGDFLNSTDR